jgi:hypothetical protein
MSSNANRGAYSGSFMSVTTTERMRERRSIDTTEFDVERVYETFVRSLREPNNRKSPIGTQDYIDGYRELLK